MTHAKNRSLQTARQGDRVGIAAQWARLCDRLPEQRTVDFRLLFGTALFGIGWGLSGYCPGPALVSLVSGPDAVIVFVFSMVMGLLLGRWARELRYAPESEDSGAEPDTVPQEGGEGAVATRHPHSRGV